MLEIKDGIKKYKNLEVLSNINLTFENVWNNRSKW